jgi:hypothetical protein
MPGVGVYVDVCGLVPFLKGGILSGGLCRMGREEKNLIVRASSSRLFVVGNMNERTLKYSKMYFFGQGKMML